MARVAVFHNTLDFRGGADAVCLHTCAALARDHEVTLFTASTADPAAVADRFDLEFDARVVQPPGAGVLARGLSALGPYVGPQLAARTVFLRSFVLRRVEAYDAAVSTANELSLPLPSVQYVHFPQFHRDRTDVAEAGRLDGLWSRLAAPGRGELDDRVGVVRGRLRGDIRQAAGGLSPARRYGRGATVGAAGRRPARPRSDRSRQADARCVRGRRPPP
jgi:hypothetical protein